MRGETRKLEQQARAFQRILNSALGRLPNYIGDVQRGINLQAEEFRKAELMYAVGRMVTEKAFTSTTTDTGFRGNVKFYIESRTGVDVSAASEQGHEVEVLFRSGTRFRVVKNEKRGETMLITMTEVI